MYMYITTCQAAASTSKRGGGTDECAPSPFCPDSVFLLAVVATSVDHALCICDWIYKNPACCENTQVAQCAFLVAQVEYCQSPVFVIFMSTSLLLPSHTEGRCKLPRRNKPLLTGPSIYLGPTAAVYEARC